MIAVARWTSLKALLPGVGVSALVAMTATFISDHHGGPALLYALLVGIAFHFLSQGTSAAAGIQYASRSILRFGVALLGVRISADKLLELGYVPILITVFAVVATILFSRVMAKLLRLDPTEGYLSGGAVGICGASAALAISSALPRHAQAERQTLFTVVAVTVLSTGAMIVYPILLRFLGYSDALAGVVIGGTIHDVAQVVGAGYMISEKAGLIATYVKMLRVLMLFPVVVSIALLFARSRHQDDRLQGSPIPLFLLGFASLATASSMGVIPGPVTEVLSGISRWCLIIAIAALGMKTSLQDIAQVGGKSLFLVCANTVFLLASVLLLLLFMR